MELSGELKVKPEYYDQEPVLYCKDCLSLCIYDMDGFPYCNKCGSADIGEASIQQWEKMYEEKYGHKYLIKQYKGNGKEFKTKGWI